MIFDTEGNLIGSDYYHLTASQYPTDNSIWVPNTGQIEGMDWLPDGDMVAAKSSGIVRINPSSGESVITSAIDGYGVVVGPAGMVYVAGNPWVMKLDPERRITPRGDVSVLASWKSKLYDHVHGLDWGSGLNEWRTDAIYAAWPYYGNRVAEIVVGIPSRKYEGRYRLVNADW